MAQVSEKKPKKRLKSEIKENPKQGIIANAKDKSRFVLSKSIHIGNISGKDLQVDIIVNSKTPLKRPEKESLCP